MRKSSWKVRGRGREGEERRGASSVTSTCVSDESMVAVQKGDPAYDTQAHARSRAHACKLGRQRRAVCGQGHLRYRFLASDATCTSHADGCEPADVFLLGAHKNHGDVPHVSEKKKTRPGLGSRGCIPHVVARCCEAAVVGSLVQPKLLISMVPLKGFAAIPMDCGTRREAPADKHRGFFLCPSLSVSRSDEASALIQSEDNYEQAGELRMVQSVSVTGGNLSSRGAPGNCEVSSGTSCGVVNVCKEVADVAVVCCDGFRG